MNKIIKNIMMTVLICCCLLVYDLGFAHGPVRGNRGLFSWKSNVFQDNGTQLFSFMKKNGFTELYQAFSDSLDDSAFLRFLSNAKKEKLDVYVLVGDPTWALDPKGEKMRESVVKAARIHKAAGGGIKGIVFDIEPHSMPKWSKNSKDIMESFVSGMKQAYQEAKKQGFEVIICIPFYYDDEGVSTGLKSLIRTGCDRIAIMNYYKSREAEQIGNEMRYAQRYDKGVINIFEFKPSGQKGLRDINTYFSDGFDSALISFDAIKAAYPDADLIMAAHDYEVLKELIKQ